MHCFLEQYCIVYCFASFSCVLQHATFCCRVTSLRCPNLTRHKQTVVKTVTSSNNYFWNFPNDASCFADAFAMLLQASNPLVFSLSYGLQEQSSGLQQASQLLALIATSNKTIVASSGDNGLFGSQGCPCNNCTTSPNPAACCSATCCAAAYPSFPATSPWVSAVGATQITPTGWNPLLQETLTATASGEIGCR